MLIPVAVKEMVVPEQPVVVLEVNVMEEVEVDTTEIDMPLEVAGPPRRGHIVPPACMVARTISLLLGMYDI